MQEKNFSQALQHSTKALDMYKIVYQKENYSDIAECLSEIALANISLKSKNSAEKAQKIALAVDNITKAEQIIQELFPAEHPNKAHVFSTIGRAYELLGEPHKALEYYEASLTMYNNWYEVRQGQDMILNDTVFLYYKRLKDNIKTVISNKQSSPIQFYRNYLHF